MDDPPRITQYTVRELSYCVHKNWKKIFENQCPNVMLRWPGMTFEERKRAIGTLTASMSAKDVARHF